ncbi:MAG: acetate/propionate family kinase [Dongiaceae bacterium]
MTSRLLTLNAGSSSLKFAVYEITGDALTLQLRGQIAGIGTTPRLEAKDAQGETLDLATTGAIGDHRAAIATLLDWLKRSGHGTSLAGAGHRVVHGGTAFTGHCRLTPDAVAQLAALEPLAPHHQPHNVAAIRALAAQMPDLPQVACFDTAFHATQPPEARRLALPRDLAAKGLQRYGFHGLSYEYVTQRLRDLSGGALPQKLVISHLGNGASMCAISGGRSIATTMGFSTLDGLIMATRIGALDPGVILHLMRTEGYGLKELEDLLYNRSGLLGLSGLSPDMRTLLASPEPAAREAVAQYCYRIGRELGSLAAALGGLDALVFTGGIGENAAPVRAAVCRDATWLGIELDAAANDSGDQLITTKTSRTAAWVLPTDEELVIAAHTRRLLEL